MFTKAPRDPITRSHEPVQPFCVRSGIAEEAWPVPLNLSAPFLHCSLDSRQAAVIIAIVRARIVAALLAVAGFLAGCGGSGSTTTSSSDGLVLRQWNYAPCGSRNAIKAPVDPPGQCLLLGSLELATADLGHAAVMHRGALGWGVGLSLTPAARALASKEGEALFDNPQELTGVRYAFEYKNHAFRWRSLPDAHALYFVETHSEALANEIADSVNGH
jgi:hypothetical protein